MENILAGLRKISIVNNTIFKSNVPCLVLYIIGKKLSHSFEYKTSVIFKVIQSICPSNGKIIAQVKEGTVSDYKSCTAASISAWNTWVDLPAPKRGEIVRQIGDALRKKLVPLGQLVSLEMGKFTNNTCMFKLFSELRD